MLSVEYCLYLLNVSWDCFKFAYVLLLCVVSVILVLVL